MAPNFLTISFEIRKMVVEYLDCPTDYLNSYLLIPPSPSFKDFVVLARVCQHLRAEITGLLPTHAPLHLSVDNDWNLCELRPLNLLPSTYLDRVRQLFVHGWENLGPVLDHILPIVPNIEHVRITPKDYLDLLEESPLMMNPHGVWSISALEQSNLYDLARDHVHQHYIELKPDLRNHEYVTISVEKEFGWVSAAVNGPNDQHLGTREPLLWFAGETFELEHWIAAYARPTLNGHVMVGPPFRPCPGN